MSLKIKSFKQIFVNMADWVATKSERLLDFSEGSIIRLLLESVATEIEEYYFKTYSNMLYAMENSIYNAFGFDKKSAEPSNGYLTITLADPQANDFVLQKGMKFRTRNYSSLLEFETKSNYLVSAGTKSFKVMVYCTSKGSDTNVLPNTIVTMVNPLSIVSDVTNEEAFITGRDEESDEERRQRFNNFIESRTRGTKQALEYGTLSVEGIRGCYVDDSKVGIVIVYCHDNAGNLDEYKKQEVIDTLEEYKVAGIPVFVQPIRKINVDVDVTIDVLKPYNSQAYKDKLELKIYEFLCMYTLGKDFILSDLNTYIRSLDSIAIKNCTINTPTKDISIENYQLVRYGNIKVTLVNYEG